MATPVKFLPTKEVSKCFAPACCSPEIKDSVYHEGGGTHPMHIECALQMIQEKESCGYCTRPVHGESLHTLAKREVKDLEASTSPAASPSVTNGDEEYALDLEASTSPAASPSVTSGDEGYALQLQHEFDEENVQARQEQLELDEEYARSYYSNEEGSSEVRHRAPSGASASAIGDDPRTAYDDIIAEGLQAEEVRRARLQQNAPPPPHVVARARGNQGISCSGLTKAAVGVVGLAFTIGMVVKAMQGA